MADAAAWNGRWFRARFRRRKPGVTVVIVNFNGDGFIQVAHSAIRRFAPEDVPILVVDKRCSFRGGTYEGRWCDVGEIISLSHPGRVHLLPVTESIGPGIVGSVFGGVVYHNFYGMRFTLEEADVLDGRVKRDDVATV